MWRLQDQGQAYDDASAMSSEACGVQGRMRRIAPMALCTHCNSHVLNLSVAAAGIQVNVSQKHDWNLK